ncbi:MAG: type IX secretion system protein PorQ [Flavobacterium sp.]
MFSKPYFYFLFLFSAVSFAQIGGKSVYQFLNIVSSPRQAALGGKIITNYDSDVNQVLLNPASVNSEMDKRLAMNYANYLGDVSIGSAAYSSTFNQQKQPFFAGVNYISYGKFDGRDENGNATSGFTASEVAVSVGTSYVIPNSDFNVGFNAKFISSAFESYNSLGGAFDLGLIYLNEKNALNCALVTRNIGTQFTTYAGTRENLPFEIIFGVSKQLQNVPLRWHFTLENLQKWDVSFSNPVKSTSNFDGTETAEEVSFFNNALRHLVIGAELFPQKKINVRLGYNFRRGQELNVQDLTSFSGLSLGFGLKLKRVKFDYSYSRYTLASNTSLFGLTINFKD